MKSWLYTIFLCAICSLIAINVFNGARYTYYSMNDIVHSFSTSAHACVTNYSFFDKTMACYAKENK